MRSDVASLLDHSVFTSKGSDFHRNNKCVGQTGTLRCFCAYFVCLQVTKLIYTCSAPNYAIAGAVYRTRKYTLNEQGHHSHDFVANFYTRFIYMYIPGIF